MAHTVAIVDDDEVVLEALAKGLRSCGGFVCRSFTDPERALEQIVAQPPDVVLMDLRLPGSSGIDCTRWLTGQRPQLPVVMLSGFADGDAVFAALAAGAVGFLEKPIDMAECAGALREAIEGGFPLSARAKAWVIGGLRSSPGVWHSSVLSDREREILTWFQQGLREKEVADRLNLAPSTVHTHVQRLYRKLRVHSRGEALMRVFRQRNGGGLSR